MSLKYQVIGAMFEALSLARVPALVRKSSKARGVIFTLHRVLPEKPAPFSPNAILQIRPDFLDFTIGRIRALGIDIVSLDEAVRRTETPEPENDFVVFTFDDGYRDNLEHALPILRRHQCPFTLYVPTALVDGVAEVWWQALEDIIARQDAIKLTDAHGQTQYLGTETLAQKHQVYSDIYWRMRKMAERERVALIRDLAESYGLDLDAHCRALIMDWSELQTFADDPLCTIGAHTVHHYELAKLTASEASGEIAQSLEILRERFGETPRHLSYPIGGPASAGDREFAIARELGLKSAVTTRPGGVYHHHKDTLHALPRVSLNGLFQQKLYVDVFATGALFTAMGKFTG